MLFGVTLFTTLLAINKAQPCLAETIARYGHIYLVKRASDVVGSAFLVLSWPGEYIHAEKFQSFRVLSLITNPGLLTTDDNM
jgi:hypothetical protein